MRRVVSSAQQNLRPPAIIGCTVEEGLTDIDNILLDLVQSIVEGW